ncbi:putative glycolipid-binding domain-containing protein [Pseudonocardia sp. H11422]|uniref:putative glycolipid-binding domain-containing protein n=1 Tax=Pseudonocardia sp. H11422 TaxID=2835866 RepID=UPI001BDC45C9|nr:putative glycolipid-binding domain-containing protein [Pseudonocardia sp. H11422]
MTSMLTWQADGAVGLEGTRLLLGAGGFRALGRLVRLDGDEEFTASYRVVVGEDGTVQRLSVTAATAARERHLTLNRTEDGFWLLDTGSGSDRSEFGGAVDVDLEYSPLFNTLPIRRLGLHREVGDHVLPVVFVALPDLEVELVDQRYRTVSTLDDGLGEAVIGFSSGDFAAELAVDGDAVVSRYPGVAQRVTAAGAEPAVG